MATPSPPLLPSFGLGRSRSGSTGSEAGNSSLEEAPEALVALAAGAGFLSPSRPPKSSRSSFSGSSGNITPLRLDTPPAEDVTPRASLRSRAGRLVLDVRTLRTEGQSAVDVKFRLADRTVIPRSLLSSLKLQTCQPASSLPDYLRPFCTSLFVHGSPLDCFIEEDMETPDPDQQGRKGSNVCAAAEGMISLADFCYASGGVARLQRDGEVTVDFRS